MKWLKRLVWRWNREGQELLEDDSFKPVRSRLSRFTSTSTGDIDADEGLNITMRKAIGGKIITFRHYDNKTDRHNYKLYIISDDMDFDKELGKMITMESMRL
jgi:hypothetical protein